MTDLISEEVGGRVVDFNDQFFAEADNLLVNSAPAWKEEKFTDRGKWMDGWETRRRREPGHDWCVLALGVPGRISRVTIDTAHFTGNYPEEFSLDACGVGVDERLDDAEWVEVISPTRLEGDSAAEFDVADAHRVTHLRLNIYPDGGVARLRVEGEPIPGMNQVCPEGQTDLLAAGLGGVALEASDVHYSAPSNLLRATAPAGMWDGWETRRRRGPGHDWATFRLGIAGHVERVEVDTRHFKGNSPGWVSIDVSDDAETWTEVVGKAPVQPDSRNEVDLAEPARTEYLRFSIHPDGGVARLRAWGRPDRELAGEKRLHYLNSLFDQEARHFFDSACSAKTWVRSMLSSRPFPDVATVFTSTVEAFANLREEDWLEAFTGHPRIGERGDDVENREQAGVSTATDALVAELEDVNRLYEEKFGFIYIVYASGKTAEEMLEIARQRLSSTREDEIPRAAEQQKAITETRLRRMLCQVSK